MVKKVELAKGYHVSPVINGCWQLSQGHSLKNDIDFKDVMGAFFSLAEQGFTTFFCAYINTGVEAFLGKFILELKNSNSVSPHDIQIHTKYVPDIDMLSEVDFTFTEKIIDRSLKRLNKEVLDIVQFHWWDYDVPGCVDVAGYLTRLQEKGKIRHIGVTNFDTPHLAELIEAGIPVISCQTQYSLFDRRPEKQLKDYCQEKGISLLCYGTLSGGFLSERWIGKKVDTVETRSQVKYLQVIEDTLGWDNYQKLLVLLDGIAKKHDVEIAQVAVSYILHQKAVGSAIVGVRNSKHVLSTQKICSFELTEEEMDMIRTFVTSFPILEGEPFGLERTIGSKYRDIMKMNLNESE